MIRKETADDTKVQELCQMITNGLPTSRLSVPNSIRPYFNHCNELTVVNGLVMKGTRVLSSLYLFDKR